MTNQLDTNIKLTYGGANGTTAILTDGNGRPVSELYLLKNYQAAIKHLYALMDTVETAVYDDYRNTVSDFLQSTRGM